MSTAKKYFIINELIFMCVVIVSTFYIDLVNLLFKSDNCFFCWWGGALCRSKWAMWPL